MKKLILLSVLSLVMCMSTNGQWYFNKYGVNSFDDLTQSQLEETLKNLNSRQNVLGIGMLVLTISGAVIFYVGASTGSGETIGTYVGLIILTLELYTSPLWATVLIVRGVRISKIKKALASPTLKLGVLPSPVNIYKRNYLNLPATGVTVTFNF